MKMKNFKTVIAIVIGVATVAGSGLTAFAAPVTMPDGQVFDAEFYAKTYPDVVAVLGTDPATLYKHYQTYGKKEGRLPYAPATQNNTTPAAPTSRPSDVPATASEMADGGWFDPAFYALTYPDVVKALGKDAAVLYKHYLTYGKKEGRLPYAASAAKANATTAATNEYRAAYNGAVNEYNKAYNEVLNEYNKAAKGVASSLPPSLAKEYMQIYNETVNEYNQIYQDTMNEYQSMVNDILGSYGF
ncbi:MAG: hypothetical protein K6F53_10275 [Lachnospiraceae bacterium]|nr:hypothetical protein [Lachnospiraceae bacterium]